MGNKVVRHDGNNDNDIYEDGLLSCGYFLNNVGYRWFAFSDDDGPPLFYY